MSDREEIENARAEIEAREASAQRTSRGPVARAIQAALTKYLVSERYHDRGPTSETPSRRSKPRRSPAENLDTGEQQP